MLYLVTEWVSGITRHRAVEVRTPQAAARKIVGRGVILEDAHATAAGGLWQARFLAPHIGSVEWPRDDAVRLVYYAHRPSEAPFWAIPEKWLDGATNPITPVECSRFRTWVPPTQPTPIG